jgi:inhibitor of KinA sporulation pathway (predicted exonuclease)
MNPRMWALDLEMNQPSQKIIQVGVVIGDILTGKIITRYSRVINPRETLTPFITELTGITQVEVDNGYELDQVMPELEALLTKSKACKSPICWGNGDLRLLKAQALTSSSRSSILQDIHRDIDIKTIHQLMAISKGKSMKGGLDATLKTYGLEFIGRPHNALDDALNTFRLACHYSELFRKLV